MNRTRENEIQEACNNCTVRWINRHLNPRKDVDRVEGCMILAAVFMIALAIGTPRRRQSRSIVIRYGVEGMFILSFPLISFTLGLMQGEVIRMELYPVWAMFLAMLFGGTNAMTVQKLDENKQSMRLYCESLLIMLYIGAILGMFLTATKELPYIRYVVLAVIILLTFKNSEQWLAAGIASKPSNGIKWLASYMKREHQLSTYYDPCTMQGYKYEVLIHIPRSITLDKIWCDNIGILSSSNSSPPVCRLKDLCLSFSLFHLVVRRYFGYTCAESKLDKTRDLVLHGLLRTEQDYERAFQVIEEELAFVHDFFTKYAYIMYGREVQCCAVSLAFTSVSVGVGIWALSALNPHNSILKNRMVETSTKDVLVTKIAFVALSISQLLQIWSYCVSDWAKVSLVCKYALNPAWQGNASIEKLLLLLGRSGRWLHSWSNTIDQYSVLDPPSSRYWDRLKHFFQSGKAGKPVKLSTEVKTAVARTIKNSISSGRLSNGVVALMRYGMKDHLCWACLVDDEFTPTHSILVWHIATSYCEISEMVRYPDENYDHSNQAVATSLSRYCAYLVAFSPALLPGSPAETKCTLDELVEEVAGVLQNLASPGEKYEKLRELNNVVDSGQSRAAQLLTKAVILGKALETKNRTTRWNLLADFWAEMLVYVAPSDNIAGHIEPLAQGGEFMTHVWALLMHAGILERPAAVP
uniref:Uncharacterized protein n=1 Tax=Avena sativa TaxID=4498 RepID=A0ACD5XCU6_AVESA